MLPLGSKRQRGEKLPASLSEETLVPPDQVLLTSHRAGKNTSPRLMSSQISSSPLTFALKSQRISVFPVLIVYSRAKKRYGDPGAGLF